MEIWGQGWTLEVGIGGDIQQMGVTGQDVYWHTMLKSPLKHHNIQNTQAHQIMKFHKSMNSIEKPQTNWYISTTQSAFDFHS